MNTELMEALTILEKEKNISKDVMMDAIENSLISACKNHFGTSDNIKVIMDRDTCDYAVYAEKNVVEEVEDPALEISLEEAEKLDSALQVGDIAQIPVHSKEFGRIATQNAKNLILQKIREEERKVVFDQYFEKEKDIVTAQSYVLPLMSDCISHSGRLSRLSPPRSLPQTDLSQKNGRFLLMVSLFLCFLLTTQIFSRSMLSNLRSSLSPAPSYHDHAL